MVYNPAFSIIETSLSPKEASSLFSLEKKGKNPLYEDRHHTRYFMLKLPERIESFPHEGGQIAFQNHHFSLYERIGSRDELSAAHYTARFGPTAEKIAFTARVYFDLRGNLLKCSLKNAEEEAVDLLPRQKQFLTRNSQELCSEIICKLFGRVQTEFGKLREEADDALTELTQMSKKQRKKHSLYLKQMKRCQEKAERAARLCLDEEEQEKLLERASFLEKAYSRVKDSSITKKKKEKATPSAPSSPEPLPAIPSTAVAAVSAPKKTPEKRLKEIEACKRELKGIENRVDRLLRERELLKEEFELIPKKQVHHLCTVYEQINANHKKLEKQLYPLLDKRDYKRFDALIKMGCTPGYDVLVLLVYRGKIERRFKQLCRREKFLIDIGKTTLDTLYAAGKLDPKNIPYEGARLAFGFLDIAYRGKQLKMFQELLQMGCCPDVYTFVGGYLLMNTILKRDTEFSVALVKAGANVNKGIETLQSYGKKHNLTYSTEGKGAKKTEKALMALQNKWKEEGQYHTPFLLAAFQKDKNLLPLMLEEGGNLEERTKQGLTAFGIFCMKISQKDDEELLSLFLKKGNDIDQPQFDGQFSPLYVACQKKNYLAIYLLTKLGGDPDKKFTTKFKNPLGEVVEQQFSALELLLVQQDQTALQFMMKGRKEFLAGRSGPKPAPSSKALLQG